MLCEGGRHLCLAGYRGYGWTANPSAHKCENKQDHMLGKVNPSSRTAMWKGLAFGVKENHLPSVTQIVVAFIPGILGVPGGIAL